MCDTYLVQCNAKAMAARRLNKRNSILNKKSFTRLDHDDVGMHDNYLFKKYTSPAYESCKSGSLPTDSSYTEIDMFTKHFYFINFLKQQNR